MNENVRPSNTVGSPRIACFTGHRNLSGEELSRLPERLETVITDLAAKGCRTFRTGGARGFDTLAALCVLQLRDRLGLRLELYLPCPDQTRGWPENEKRVWNLICRRADEVKILSPVYYDGCMLARNRQMADGADVCVAFCRDPSQSRSGTAYTVRYAMTKGLHILSLIE